MDIVIFPSLSVSAIPSKIWGLQRCWRQAPLINSISLLTVVTYVAADLWSQLYIHNEAIISKWQLGCLIPCSINYYTLYFFIIKNNYYDFIVTCYLILLQENLNVNTNQGPGNPVMKPQIPCLKYWPWPLVIVETVSPPRSCKGHAENVSNPCKELFSIGLLFFQWGRQIFIKINW